MSVDEQTHYVVVTMPWPWKQSVGLLTVAAPCHVYTTVDDKSLNEFGEGASLSVLTVLQDS